MDNAKLDSVGHFGFAIGSVFVRMDDLGNKHLRSELWNGLVQIQDYLYHHSKTKDVAKISFLRTLARKCRSFKSLLSRLPEFNDLDIKDAPAQA